MGAGETLGAPELLFLGYGPWSHNLYMQNILIVQRKSIWRLGELAREVSPNFQGSFPQSCSR